MCYRTNSDYYKQKYDNLYYEYKQTQQMYINTETALNNATFINKQLSHQLEERQKDHKTMTDNLENNYNELMKTHTELKNKYETLEKQYIELKTKYSEILPETKVITTTELRLLVNKLKNGKLDNIESKNLYNYLHLDKSQIDKECIYKCFKIKELDNKKKIITFYDYSKIKNSISEDVFKLFITDLYNNYKSPFVYIDNRCTFLIGPIELFIYSPFNFEKVFKQNVEILKQNLYTETIYIEEDYIYSTDRIKSVIYMYSEYLKNNDIYHYLSLINEYIIDIIEIINEESKYVFVDLLASISNKIKYMCKKDSYGDEDKSEENYKYDMSCLFYNWVKNAIKLDKFIYLFNVTKEIYGDTYISITDSVYNAINDKHYIDKTTTSYKALLKFSFDYNVRTQMESMQEIMTEIECHPDNPLLKDKLRTLQKNYNNLIGISNNINSQSSTS